MESPRSRCRNQVFVIILMGLFIPLTTWAASPSSARTTRPRVSQPSSASRTASVPAPVLKDWTVLVYMACDNNLEAAAEGDLNEMETVGSNERMNILVQLDRIGSFSQDTVMKWTGAKRFHIQKDDKPNLVTSPIVQDLGEIDMAAPKTLVDFVAWAKKKFPAKQYALILSNHGTGWKEVQPDGVVPAIGNRSRHPGYRTVPGGPEAAINPFGTPRRASTRQHADVLSPDMQRAMGAISYNIAYDDTTGTSMDIPTLGDTLAKVQGVLQQPLDLLGFDACLMQMLEVAFESAPHARFQVGATDLEPERGWPYDQIFEALAKDPDMDARKLGQTIVSCYTASYNSGSQGNTAVVLSLFDLSKMKRFTDTLERFCASLHKDIVEVDAIDQARASALKYCYQDYVDLGHFTRLLAEKTKLTGLQRAARELFAEIKEDSKDGFVVANSHTGDKYAEGSGISIYFPDRTSYRPFQKRYALLQMSKDSVWDDFLSEYENPNLPYIRIRDITFDDANHDGRITAGEKVDVFFTLKNLGRKTTDKIEFAWETPSKQVSFQKVETSHISVPKPGAEVKVKGCEFTVSADTPANTQIPILFKLSGPNVPVSTYQTSFFVKPAFQTTGQALLVFTDNFSPAPPVLQAMFNEAGIKFDTWDRMMDGNLKPEVLKRYLDGWVYLSVQDSSDQQALAADEIDALTGFLRSGGRLVLSGQDLAFSLRETPFLKDLCRLSFVQDDTNVHVLSGTAHFLPATTCQIFGGDGANNQKWPDEIDPLAGAKVIMKFEAGARDIADHKAMRGPNIKPPSTTRGIKSSGAAGVSVVDGYRLLFFAFGVEAINTAQQRQQLLKQIQVFMTPTLNTQITDYANASGRRSRNRIVPSTQLLDDVDLLSTLRPRIVRQLRNSMEKNPQAAETAIGQIERLPAAQREAANDLERDVRALLEFQRQHGTLTPR